MKFTIDTEEKIITFNEPFTKKDIEDVMSVLKIEGIESWKISMTENKQLELPLYPNQRDEYNPPYQIYCSNSSDDLDYQYIV
jgi:hypothetical protein